jgi:hypothetical protein
LAPVTAGGTALLAELAAALDVPATGNAAAAVRGSFLRSDPVRTCTGERFTPCKPCPMDGKSSIKPVSVLGGWSIEGNVSSSSSELLRFSLPAAKGLLSSSKSPNPAKEGPIGEKSSTPMTPPGVSIMEKLRFGED